MKKNYYDWPKIMAKKTDGELKEIYREAERISEDKRNAVEQEMVQRGILNKEGVKKIKKIDSEIVYLAAKLYKEGMSFADIERRLLSSGLNNINSKKLVDELRKWVKTGKSKQIIFISIGSVLTLIALILYATKTFSLGIGPWMVIGAFIGVGLTTLSPKKFKKTDIYEIIDKEE